MGEIFERSQLMTNTMVDLQAKILDTLLAVATATTTTTTLTPTTQLH